MRHNRSLQVVRGGRRLRDVPIYKGTRCSACGGDQGVAVRHGDAVLCLDCYRVAARTLRDRRRRIGVLLRVAAAANPAAVVAQRCARLSSHFVGAAAPGARVT
jgi:hypothetical protein